MSDDAGGAPLLETQAVLASNWRVAPVAENEEDLNQEMLLAALGERIFHLLGYNMEKLLSSMYILDISEARFGEAMQAPTMKDRARRIAEIVYGRETEKIQSRRNYAGPVYGRLKEGDTEKT